MHKESCVLSSQSNCFSFHRLCFRVSQKIFAEDPLTEHAGDGYLEKDDEVKHIDVDFDEYNPIVMGVVMIVKTLSLFITLTMMDFRIVMGLSTC